MPRTPISAGNWKMNGSAAEAAALSDGLQGIHEIPGVHVVLAPSYLQIAAVAQRFAGTGGGVAGQNIHFETSGAFTGEVSPTQLAEHAGWVILGHSERRQYFCEDDPTLNKKLAAAHAAGLRAILCIGESLDERENDRTKTVLTRQLHGALEGQEIPIDFVIAYEPVWAIGTGQAATPAEAEEACVFIRGQVAEIAGADRADGLRVLYGGSVNVENVADFIAQPDVDGALVGGASLKADAFLAITRAIAASANS